ncbi:MAG: Phosphoglycerate kinase [Candidatus Woesebacteria bacterium GW2011_GWB1_43_14]|uniref:Phosphoglycerate kinase n=1 Tax=Candidatus Woesebacteria bacterium GW2011_GWB1_43_14 TaxID=1618578 RepID=A0A0G1DMN6_9BACT|nr:MAG: Phosphoglycerate kinase [Candidatus Woesebacteria bacterium GW2011_GWC1_42_9]KKS98914.1 MAG: Phosphoglycerate kinase [Candidatus Woesebacteria bacterium GW2011_GWB1_43_14]
MKLPSINDFSFKGKRVLLRGDIDVVEGGKITDDTRLLILLPTINNLFQKGAAKITLIGHIGRPGGKKDEQLSTNHLKSWFEKRVKGDEFVVYENLRFWRGEEENDDGFSRELAELGEVFVNEAFATSHRRHASIVGVPKYLKTVFGFRFLREVENLDKILDSPKKPVIMLIGGVKKGKLDYLEGLKNIADKVLVGGRLPEYLGEDHKDKKIAVARLMPDKEDITINSIEKFIKILSAAGTIFVSGPMGKFEEEGHMMGTKSVFENIANSKALKIAGGGDTEEAITKLRLNAKFDWISVGGGASLEYLTKRTLPAIEALIDLS